jgi:hypothetical protein
MMHGSRDRPCLWIRVFGAPILLAVMTVAGLLAALLWSDHGRYVAWMTVGAPVAVVLWVWLRRGREKHRNSGRRAPGR